ncbi:MAG: nucleotidyltransferase family protein [Alphaproteobacteria bacterium]|nr:nucleotidyltransferase family protein [Alphaproteobacteria bacterium]MBU0859252.1 nucleotidyltransferase family protein [Alphaproteobacteria bacterium]
MSNSALPDKAFILAAGRGNRLRPHTDTLPKPLVPVAGRPIIDYVIDGVAGAGVTDVTVNLHYMADKLEAHLKARHTPHFTLSHEDVLLDTGGGIKNALHTMGADPFYIVSGDSFWDNGPSGNALHRMAKMWDPDKMDLLLMMQPVDKLHTSHAVGDYDLLPDGRAVRSHTRTGTHMWTSIRMCDARLFDGTPDEPFSFLTLMDRAESKGRLYALVHDGAWYHITTPEDLDQINAVLKPAPVYA